MHAGKERVAAGRAALLGIVVREDRAFIADAIDIGRLADHQAAMVDARLVEADVVTHDEEDIGLLCLLCGCRRDGRPGQRHQHRRAEQRGTGRLAPSRWLGRRNSGRKRLVIDRVTKHGIALLFMMRQWLLA
jgi:hypothetical protein